ncbi:hypothetical protein [Priestia megaterium]|uniref:hypothetical protein n=1 Tax=Priestia megaterium TaxID=1404 RepID=UPI002E241C4D|nr:hypothetical protein [Priestia megaterium]
MEVGKEVKLVFKGSQELEGVISQINSRIVSVTLKDGSEVILERTDVEVAPKRKPKTKKNP